MLFIYQSIPYMPLFWLAKVCLRFVLYVDARYPATVICTVQSTTFAKVNIRDKLRYILLLFSLKAAEQHQLDVNIALKRQATKRKPAAPPPPNPFTGTVDPQPSPPKNPFEDEEPEDNFLLPGDEVSATCTNHLQHDVIIRLKTAAYLLV